ncbi:MAG: LytTR family DNA-binding domain-containing protein [Veillonellaceae bacterium]|nr:LytTR family DNA-binding domain-containing protein [Veillonellaceae bacterium]MDD7655724.1 LytTR family DNA-binding domain-containing protein [Veillonellaceae bacterium]MDY5330033.1 LytTR family DNA-binding domain-containing protein [Anaerovibrio sp.]
MKILIYDDDLEELTHLSELLESLLSKRHIQADVQGVSTQQDFHNYLAQEEPDVVFLDIYLDDEAMGTELAKELREAKKNFSLIFVSTSNSYAWESYAVGADYYLLKPVTEASLGAALDKLEVFHPTQLITIDTGRRYLSFNIDKIVAIEIRDKLCYIHTVSGIVREYCPLYTFDELLQHDCFLKVNRSVIINMHYVEGLEEDTFVMPDGLRAVVRSREQKQMRALYLDWTFKNL